MCPACGDLTVLLKRRCKLCTPPPAPPASCMHTLIYAPAPGTTTTQHKQQQLTRPTHLLLLLQHHLACRRQRMRLGRGAHQHAGRGCRCGSKGVVVVCGMGRTDTPVNTDASPSTWDSEIGALLARPLAVTRLGTMPSWACVSQTDLMRPAGCPSSPPRSAHAQMRPPGPLQAGREVRQGRTHEEGAAPSPSNRSSSRSMRAL